MADTTQFAFAHDMLRQCRRTLGGSKNSLTGIIEAHEQDFLSLGEELYALQSSCEDISRTAQTLVSCTSGQAMHTTLSALSKKLEALTDDRARAAGRQSLEEIDGVIRIVDELSDILSAFSKIVKYLSILGIATRIESARLGNEGRGFTTLADDVEKLAHQIVEHCAGIAGRIETLRGHIQSARQRNLAILATQEQCHEVIVRQLAANIVALGRMASCSNEVSLELSRTAEEIASDIGQAVRSMQSHDIVRQQVEHAEHALVETAEMLDIEVTDEVDTKTVLELLAFVADVFTLQTSQIGSADEHFTHAADALRNSLASLAGRIRGIGETISGIDGAGTTDTPLTRLEAGVVTVKSELGDFANAGEALGTIMDSVAETIAGMGGAIEAIEEVGTEIELIAINASIKAAHTGEAGAALGVLALAIQRLSGDARRQTDAVARILGDIARASTRLQDNAGRYNDQSEAWQIIGELDAVLTDTSGTSRQCQELFASLDESSHTWGARADELAHSIDFDRDIDSSFSGIRHSLDEQIAAARKLVPSGGKGRSNRLRQLYDRYTMEAERDVHEAAFGQSRTKQTAKPQAKSLVQEPTEFGDNVELF